MAHFHGSVSSKHVHGDGSWTTAPAIGTITPADTSISFTHTGGGTHYRVYALAGAPGSWVSLGASPVTVAGLTANTEYTLDISGDGSTVSDTENFGTTNPGSGGGEIPTGYEAAATEGAAAGEAASATLAAAANAAEAGAAAEASTCVLQAVASITAAAAAAEASAATATGDYTASCTESAAATDATSATLAAAAAAAESTAAADACTALRAGAYAASATEPAAASDAATSTATLAVQAAEAAVAADAAAALRTTFAQALETATPIDMSGAVWAAGSPPVIPARRRVGRNLSTGRRPSNLQRS